jgi:hypothetical protein
MPSLVPLSYELPWLTVAGNRIVRATDGEPVLLRGINRSGMEYRGDSGEEWDEAEFDRMACEWGANILRIPFNQDWALAREGYDATAYLAAMDRAVSLAGRRGAYTLLALQWRDNRTAHGYDADGRAIYIPPLPDGESVELWRQLAARYRAEPAVLYDILTEPHDVSMRQWQPWARELTNAIREQNPAALVFVSGVDWGYDLRGHPVSGLDGVVYSTHVYRNKGRNWDAAFGNLSKEVPVFAAEWGGFDGDLDWGRELAAYLAERSIGWTAWGWPDRPPLIGDDCAPTKFGALVRSLLLA